MKRILAAVLAVGLVTVAVGQARFPEAPEGVMQALWRTCFADEWVVVGEWALTCVAERIRRT